MRSWIVLTIVMYFIGASLSVLIKETGIWKDYFWYITLVFGTLSLAFNFKINKTELEANFIIFAFIYRIFTILYYFIGEVSGNMLWLEENMFFFSSIALSGIIGMGIRHRKLWKIKRDLA